MTTDLPEGRHVLTNRPVLTKRHVLTKRSLSGRVAAVFTSDYCSDDLQVGSVLCSYCIWYYCIG